MLIRPHVLSLGLFAICTVVAGCAGGSNSSGTITPTITTTPSTANIRAADTQLFSASVSGLTNTAVTWSVNGVAGGNSTVGTITTAGVYTAPSTLPNPASVVVQAASAAQPSVFGVSNVALLNPIPVLASVSPKNIGVGSLTIYVTGSKFASGAVIQFGSAALTTIFVSPTLLSATLNATSAQAGSVAVTVKNPDPGSASSGSVNAQVSNTTVVSAAAAARFLEQTTFGPTQQLVNQVQYVGFTNFLQDQYDAPQSTFDDAVADSSGNFVDATTLQQRWFTNALFGPDQLRQRVAFALHKIWVVSWVDVNDSRAFVPYLRMHQQHAFGNYRQIMENVTKNPAMGRYQDIANNDGASNRSGSCNENFGRELMQLFTIGLYKLDAGGVILRDSQSKPIPAYDPIAVVQENACAMTGWTYQKETPATRDWPRPPFYSGTLEAVENHHDQSGETLIDGFVISPGGTAQSDLTLTLDNIFCHPNLPPFIARLLIQQLVTSNPSPAYVQRMAGVWTGGVCTPGTTLPSQRGDMTALITAILTDPEARRGDTLAPTDPQVVNDGKLREPVLLITNVLRALGAQSNGSAMVNLANSGRPMGQYLLFPPTVFSYFSPEYQVPGSPLLAPEMAIQNTATTFERTNFLNTTAFGSLAGLTINWSPLASLATNPDTLLDNLNAALLHGTMSAEMRSSIKTALSAVPAGSSQNDQRARTAVYLIVSSSQYQVQR